MIKNYQPLAQTINSLSTSCSAVRAMNDVEATMTIAKMQIMFLAGERARFVSRTCGIDTDSPPLKRLQALFENRCFKEGDDDHYCATH